MPKVYDASALLAVIFAEPGGDAVLEHLVAPGGCVSAVNWAEAAGKMVERGLSASQAEQELAHFTLDVVALDGAMAIVVGALRATTLSLGLSLGDRSCLALARQVEDATVITADRAWKSLKGFRVTLVR